MYPDPIPIDPGKTPRVFRLFLDFSFINCFAVPRAFNELPALWYLLRLRNFSWFLGNLPSMECFLTAKFFAWISMALQSLSISMLKIQSCKKTYSLSFCKNIFLYRLLRHSFFNSHQYFWHVSARFLMGKPVILCNRPQSVVAATWCWQTLKKAPSSMKRQEKFQSYQMSQKEHQSWKVLLKCCHSQHFLRQDSCKNSRNTNEMISMASIATITYKKTPI